MQQMISLCRKKRVISESGCPLYIHISSGRASCGHRLWNAVDYNTKNPPYRLYRTAQDHIPPNIKHRSDICYRHLDHLWS
ncbi:hypothetical protein GDO86_007001 [Hymenochirus boettgeri]|uniref:Uncharacterized protein n=1 Tax=Hymenochirus boettgeri TaxID=247094 RepID=A0A8T2JAT3_9PIPI|nr:hypothetical protein GDO86_007001 [Hymenochirus boettgeri]